VLVEERGDLRVGIEAVLELGEAVALIFVEKYSTGPPFFLARSTARVASW
jgi:hypothetical protein